MVNPDDLSPKDRELIKSSVDISLSHPDERKKGYMHSVLCQVSMPRKATDEREYQHQCGRVFIKLKAGELYNGKEFVPQVLPYGRYPRLILLYLQTYATQNKTQEIDLGDNMKEFMGRIGIESSSGGKRGSYRMFKKQMQGLIASEMLFGWIDDDGAANTAWLRPVQSFNAWLSNNPEQRTLWSSKATLSAEFYHNLVQHSVPHNLDAVCALKGSALALDIYSWMAYRLCRINGNALLIHWKSLREQFGPYYNPKDFKKEFNRCIDRVQLVYPEAKFSRQKGGYLFYKSPPPIPNKNDLLLG